MKSRQNETLNKILREKVRYLKFQGETDTQIELHEHFNNLALITILEELKKFVLFFWFW